MSFLSKELLSQYSKPAGPKYADQAIPYPEIRDKDQQNLAYLKKVHEDALQNHFKSQANSLCIYFQNSKPGDKNPQYAFDPCAFQYLSYGLMKFLPLSEIVGSPEEAEAYYKKRYEEAFPDFRIDFKRREKSKYAYSVIIHIL